MAATSSPSRARLSFNGLANAFHLAAINGGRHVAPSFAGDTIYAWSEVTDKAELPGRTDMGALRLRLFAVKDRNCADFPGQKARRHLRGRRGARSRLLGGFASGKARVGPPGPLAEAYPAERQEDCRWNPQN